MVVDITSSIIFCLLMIQYSFSFVNITIDKQANIEILKCCNHSHFPVDTFDCLHTHINNNFYKHNTNFSRNYLEYYSQRTFLLLMYSSSNILQYSLLSYAVNAFFTEIHSDYAIFHASPTDVSQLDENDQRWNKVVLIITMNIMILLIIIVLVMINYMWY